jgi:plasmid maintenance system antidote protein VapI
MENKKKRKEKFQDIAIGQAEYKEWSAEKVAAVKAAVKEHAAKRSEEQKLSNEMVAIELKMIHYVNQESQNTRKPIKIADFLSQYLSVMKLSFKRFAEGLDTKDSNLKKYVDGERSFNGDLAMKFGSFFHTSPDLWLKVHAKNELLQLQENKKDSQRYKRYDYTMVIEIGSAVEAKGSRKTSVQVESRTGSSKKSVDYAKHSAKSYKAEKSSVLRDSGSKVRGSSKVAQKDSYVPKAVGKKQAR